MFKDLPTIKNLFENLKILKLKPSYFDDKFLRLIVKLARYEGLTQALRGAVNSSYERTKYLTELSKGLSADWWQPGKVWEGFSDVLFDIKQQPLQLQKVGLSNKNIVLVPSYNTD